MYEQRLYNVKVSSISLNVSSLHVLPLKNSSFDVIVCHHPWFIRANLQGAVLAPYSFSN